MTTFAEMRAQVIELTKRPDLAGITDSMIKRATLKAHDTEIYPQDLFETAIQFATPDYLQTLTYKEIFPRWKSLSYLRRYDMGSTGSAPGIFFQLITPLNSLDDYGQNKTNVMYLTGADLQIRSDTQFSNALLGAYLYPSVTETTYKSWIADEHPGAIIYEAAATVFKTIGYDEENAAYRSMVLEEYALLRQKVVANGY